MTLGNSSGPGETDRPQVHSVSRGLLEMRFVGRWPQNGRSSRHRTLERLCGSTLDLSWLRQIHSDRCLVARSGCTGRGDALWTNRPGLALCIQTADCAPIVIGNESQVAVIHAGWRGIAAGVVPTTLERLRGAKTAFAAWIGPAIGACCYEVGFQVARQVSAASTEGIVLEQDSGQIHLDLVGAVEFQLRQAGIEQVHRLGTCTFCSGVPLWSYRRLGPRAGRNFTFAWLGRDPAKTAKD